MPARGKHRRTRTSPLTRGIVAATTGAAALALPIMGATSASAAEAAPRTYTVLAGDTLAAIADEHGTEGG